MTCVIYNKNFFELRYYICIFDSSPLHENRKNGVHFKYFICMILNGLSWANLTSHTISVRFLA